MQNGQPPRFQRGSSHNGAIHRSNAAALRRAARSIASSRPGDGEGGPFVRAGEWALVVRAEA
jgi:hypothetical protein